MFFISFIFALYKISLTFCAFCVQIQMCSNDSGWFLHKGQFQLLYKSGLRFLMCSTVGSSSIKNLIFEIFLLEAANNHETYLLQIVKLLLDHTLLKIVKIISLDFTKIT